MYTEIKIILSTLSLNLSMIMSSDELIMWVLIEKDENYYRDETTDRHCVYISDWAVKRQIVSYAR